MDRDEAPKQTASKKQFLPKVFICRNGETNTYIHVEFWEALNSQNNLEKEQSWSMHSTYFQNLPQKYCK